MFRFARPAIAAFAAAACAACAALPDLPPPPSYAEWSHASSLLGRPVQHVLIPRGTSPEYLRSWGIQLVDAEPAYEAGLTGRGVTIALIDTGLALAPVEVSSRASIDSVDLIAHRALDGAESKHGGQVAQTVSAALDGVGVVGVAYGATLLSVRADVDGSCRTECDFDTGVVASGIDYAVDHGAKIIVLAMEGPHALQPAFEKALQRATDAGAVIVAAAGNEGAAEPTWPARYAADPRFARSVIAVGAADPRGSMVAWSNRAGSTRDRYLIAPGRNLIVDCGLEYCSAVSGTSYSAPYVAGALALILEARPDLTAQAGAEALLKSGRRQLQMRYPSQAGRGLLDIGAALQTARYATPHARTASARRS